MVLSVVPQSEVITILSGMYIILQLQTLSAQEHHCLIDDATALHRVSPLTQRCVCKAGRSPRYQAACAFLRL
jgi:hypothetical protein